MKTTKVKRFLFFLHKVFCIPDNLVFRTKVGEDIGGGNIYYQRFECEKCGQKRDGNYLGRTL